MSLVDRYRSWFEYEMDAHGKTLAALDTVPREAHNDRYQAALDLMAHLTACRRMWLYRMGAVNTGATTAAEIFPTGTQRAELDGLVRIEIEHAD